MTGAHAKPRLRIGGTTEIFGRLGIANTGSSVRGYTGSDGGASLSHGVGFKTQTGYSSFGNRPISVSGDYMSYHSGNGVKHTGFTVAPACRSERPSAPGQPSLRGFLQPGEHPPGKQFKRFLISSIRLDIEHVKAGDSTPISSRDLL